MGDKTIPPNYEINCPYCGKWIGNSLVGIKVLKQLLKGETNNIYQISKNTGCSYSVVHSIVYELEKRGLVKLRKGVVDIKDSIIVELMDDNIILEA